VREILSFQADALFQGFKLKVAAGVLSEADILEVNGLLAYGK
jgi:hypothetical protein